MCFVCWIWGMFLIPQYSVYFDIYIYLLDVSIHIVKYIQFCILFLPVIIMKQHLWRESTCIVILMRFVPKDMLDSARTGTCLLNYSLIIRWEFLSKVFWCIYLPSKMFIGNDTYSSLSGDGFKKKFSYFIWESAKKVLPEQPSNHLEVYKVLKNNDLLFKTSSK